MNLSQKLFYTILLTGITQVAYYYDRLPLKMASHFDGSGHPDGWMSKTAFFSLYGLIVFILFFIYHKKTLLGYLNSPSGNNSKKLSWLAKELREETLLYIGRQHSRLGLVSLFFTVSVIQLVINANMQLEPRLAIELMRPLLFIYLVYIVIWLYQIYRRIKQQA